MRAPPESVGPLVFLLLLLSVMSGSSTPCCPVENRPNIVFIYFDDVGYADIQMHNSDMYTPNMMTLRNDSVYMNNLYTMKLCTPSRFALLTGRYPYRYGVHHIFPGNGLNWVPTNLSMVQEELQDQDYVTHMIGKWHLGNCDWAVTPLNRGFSTFYGKLKGNSGYFTHSGQHSFIPDYYDFMNQTSNDTTAENKYSTNLFCERAVKIINEHNSSRPFFMYLAFQTVHVPFEVPEKYYTDNHCGDIPFSNRTIACGMIACADEGIGNITRALKEKGLYDNTIIVVTTDNGASATTEHGPGATSNFPYRGKKSSLYEGGTHVFGLVKAPGLVTPGGTWDGIMHGVDWYPTLVEAASCGVKPDAGDRDGIAMYNEIVNNLAGPRTHMMYDIKPDSFGACRGSRYKVIKDYSQYHNMGWFPPENWQQEIVYPNGSTPTGWEVYDLIEDPYEKSNIYDSHQNQTEVQELMEIIELEYSRSAITIFTKPEQSPLAAVYRKQLGFWIPGWCPGSVEGRGSCSSPSPCLHGGTCMRKEYGQYECMCPSGTSGQHCETVTPCEEVTMEATSDGNSVIELGLDSFNITAIDPTVQAKARYTTSGGELVVFRNITVHLLQGNLKRMSILVFNGGSKLESGHLRFPALEEGARYTVPFLTDPVGSSLRFDLVPENSESLKLRVEAVRHCTEASTTAAPPVTETTTTDGTTTAPPVTETPTTEACQDGKCYQFFNITKTYSDANAMCRGQPGRNLASAADDAEFSFIFDLAAQTTIWLGATDLEMEGTWVWEDGADFTFTKWKGGAPPADNVDRNCLRAIKTTGKWCDTPCSWKKVFVCKYTQ